MSYESDIAFSVAQAARREASQLRQDVANMRAQQERDAFKAWQNDTPDDEWIVRRFNSVNKNIDTLFKAVQEQSADTKSLRKDMSRLEESIFQISEIQTRQERRIALLEIREKFQAWHRLLSHSGSKEYLIDIANGLNEYMKLFALLPDSKILKGYNIICEDSKILKGFNLLGETDSGIQSVLINTFRFIDENFSSFHSELAQILEMNATKANPAAIIKARQWDESLMKPYVDRVQDEPWRENLKKWMVSQIQQDIRIVQCYNYYEDTKLVNGFPKETHGQLYDAIRGIAQGQRDLYKFNFGDEVDLGGEGEKRTSEKLLKGRLYNSPLDSLNARFLVTNPLKSSSREEHIAYVNNIFPSLFTTFVAKEHRDNENILYYSFIIDVLKHILGTFESQEALYRDMDYFCHLKRFLDNKQIDPDNIPRLVDNLCIDRNFYANLRLLEVSLDSEDPDNEEMKTYCNGLYRGFLSRLGDIYYDMGMTIAIDPKTLGNERVQGVVGTYSPNLNPSRLGTSGTALERALHCRPALLDKSAINTEAWISVFSSRCTAARPLIDLTSLPATPEEMLLILQEALKVQNADGTIPHFDLTPFALQLNTLMTGLFVPWVDADGKQRDSLWKTITGYDTATVEQMLAMQVNLIGRELCWSDGMKVTQRTENWHEWGRTYSEKEYVEDAFSFAGTTNLVNRDKYERDCTTRIEHVQNSVFAM